MTSEEKAEYNKNNLTGEFKDEYSFDDYNNITEKVHTETDTTKNTTVVSTYDKTRLSTQTENGNVITYTYDDNGNMATKTAVNGELSAVTEFSYDTFDRTASITLGNGVTTSFAYNADSDRISKTTGTKSTETVLDNGSISADLIGETVKVFSEDNSVYCENGAFTYNIINSNGDLVATSESNDVDYRYNAYGIKLSDNSTNNPIGYRNYYYDSETGLYYLKARYYNPATGQFTQEDTVQDDNLQYNLYGYCSANPVLYIDPTGHDAIFLYSNELAGSSGIYAGHSALFLECNNVWFYCSISGGEPLLNAKTSYVDFGACFTDLNAKTSISTINHQINIINKRHRKYGSTDKKFTIAGKYTDKRYFYGDFKDAMLEFKNSYYLNDNFSYDLIYRNCSEISCKIMKKGKFSGGNEYNKIFEKLTRKVLPRAAFKAIKQFYAYYPIYSKASAYRKKIMLITKENPWRYVMNL